MGYVKLTRESIGKQSRKGIATVSFTKRGLVVLSARSVQKLQIRQDGSIDVLQGDRPSDFAISKGSAYKLRPNGKGGAVFNCIALCSLVIDKTWEISPHNVLQESAPSRITFTICEKSIDDKENSHLYALLRKKL